MGFNRLREAEKMIDLESLKNTKSLVSGFDQLLASWLECEPESNVPEWPDSALEIFGKLPAVVREFYDVINRWPSSQILVDNNQDSLVCPPSRRTIWNPLEKSFEIPNADLVSLVSENQGVWNVWTSTGANEHGALFTDADPDFEPCHYPMKTSLEVFLVTFGLHELVMNGMQCEDAGKFKESDAIFFGRYHADHEMVFHYHPDGLLWFSCYDTEPFWGCKKPGR